MSTLDVEGVVQLLYYITPHSHIGKSVPPMHESMDCYVMNDLVRDANNETASYAKYTLGSGSHMTRHMNSLALGLTETGARKTG